MTAILSVYGRIGQQPKDIQTRTGTTMVTASVAVSLDVAREDELSTWWLSLLAFGKTAEQLQRCEKGDLVGVVGRLQLSRWTDQSGDTKEQHRLIVDQIVSARTVRPRGGRRASQSQDQQRRPSATAAQTPAATVRDFDDELPF